MRVAVVGAGIVGTSAARFLAQRGHDVTVLERFRQGHKNGSSHGLSRIVRKAYPDAFYAARMAEAYPLWAELQAESSCEILHEVGLVYFGNRDSADVQSVAQGLADLDVPNEVLDHDQVRRVFPALRLAKDEVAIFTPEAGHVHANNAVLASYRLAHRHGARFHYGRKGLPDKLGDAYDAYVVCAGSWVRDFVDVPVKVTLQTIGYMDAHVEGPVWIEDSPNFLYGFPTDRCGLKIAAHRAGPEFRTRGQERVPQEADLALIRDVAARRFGISDPDVRYQDTCLYTTAPNDDFLLGRLGDNGFFVSACSGHGFKFGPYMGRLLADFVEGKDAPERHPRWHWTPTTQP